MEPEPHPLWEYPSHARSDVCELMNFDLTCPVPENTTQSVNGSMVLNTLNETCHGVVLWMDYQLTDEITSTTGLLKVKPHIVSGVFFFFFLTLFHLTSLVRIPQ